MVLRNVTKFHKILIKDIPANVVGCYMDRRMYGQGYHLMPGPLSWQGHKNFNEFILNLDLCF